MPTDEYKRQAFLRALLNQQQQTVRNGGALVNPSIQNGADIGNLSAIDTNMMGISNPQLQENPEDVTTENGFVSAMKNVFGFVDELAAKFGAGFISGWEGGLDLMATGIGALGNATGWYDGNIFTDWAKQDIGTASSEWVKTYLNFTPWAIADNIANGNYANAAYWESMGESAKDLFGSAFFMSNELGDFRQYSDQYYGLNDEALQQMGGWGNFLGGVAQSFGMMLPAIMTSGGASAAGAAEGVVKGVSLATLGLGAAGKGSEEALTEGADAGRSLAYGVATGSAEVLSELAVGPVLAKIGVGTGKIMGVVGDKTVGAGSKAFIKELLKSSFEEGMEEVSTALVEPLLKSIYQGSDALKEYENPAKFLFGVGGDFNESVLGQFTSGAVTGGLMTGVSIASQVKTFGKDGLEVIDYHQQQAEAYENMMKYKEGSEKFEQYKKEYFEAIGKEIEAWNKAQGTMSEQQIKNLQQFLLNPTEFAQSLEKSQEATETITNKLNSLNDVNGDISKIAAAREFADLADIMNRRDVKIEFGDVIDEDGAEQNAKYNDKTKTITINSKLSNKYGALIGHEFGVHAIMSTIGKTQMEQLYKEVTSDKTWWTEAKQQEINENYKDNVRLEETVAKYFEDLIYGKGGNITQLQYLKSLFQKPSFAQKVMRLFNKNLVNFKSAPNSVEKAFIKAIDFVKANTSNSAMKRLFARIAEGKEFKELSKEEQTSLKNFKEVFELYSKDYKLENDKKRQKRLEKQKAEEINDEKTLYTARGAKYTFSQKELQKFVRNRTSDLVRQEWQFKTENQTNKEQKQKVIDLFEGKNSLIEKGYAEAYHNFLMSNPKYTTYDNTHNTRIINDEYLTPELLAVKEDANNFGIEKVRFLASQARNLAGVLGYQNKDGIFVRVFTNDKNYSFVDIYRHEFLHWTIAHKPELIKGLINEFMSDYELAEQVPDYYYSIVKENIDYGNHKTFINRIEKNYQLFGLDGEYDKRTNDFINKHNDNFTFDELFDFIAREYDRALNLEENLANYYADKKSKKKYDFDTGKVINISDEVSRFQEDNNIRYSKNGVTGKYTVGDNKKGLKVVYRKGGGGYEIVFDDGHKITEGVIGAETVETRFTSTRYYVEVDGEETEQFSSRQEAEEYAKGKKRAKVYSKDYEVANYSRRGGEKVDFTSADNVRAYLDEIGAVRPVYTEERGFKFKDSEEKASFIDEFKKQTDIELDFDKPIYQKFHRGKYEFTLKRDADGHISFNKGDYIKDKDTTVNFVKSGQKEASKEEMKAADLAQTKKLNYNKPMYVYDNGKVYKITVEKVQAKTYDVEYVDEKNSKRTLTAKGLTRKEFKKFKNKHIVTKSKIGTQPIFRVIYRNGAHDFNTKQGVISYISGLGIKISNNRAEVAPPAIKNGTKYGISKDGKTYTVININSNKDGTYKVSFGDATTGSVEEKTMSYQELRDELTSDKYQSIVDNKPQEETKVEQPKGKEEKAETKSKEETKPTEEKKEKQPRKPRKSLEEKMSDRVNKQFQKGQKTETIQDKYKKQSKTKVNAPLDLNTLAQNVPTEQQKAQPVNVDKLVTNEKKKIKRVAFKSVETTGDIYNKFADYVQKIAGEGFKVTVPVNEKKFVGKLFRDINNTKTVELEVRDLMKRLLELRIEDADRNFVGTIEEFFDDEDIAKMKAQLTDMIERAPNEKARSVATRDFEISAEKLAYELKEAKSNQSRTRVFTRLRDRIRRNIGRYAQITNNEIIKDGLRTLLEPFEKVHGANNAGFSAKDFRDNLAHALEWYTEENLSQHYEGLLYNDVVRTALEDVYNSLGYAVDTATGKVTGSLTTEALQKSIDAVRLINADIQRMIEHHNTKIAPASLQTKLAIGRSSYAQKANAFAKMWRMYKRGFAPRYVVVEEMLGGNSEAARIVVYGVQNAVNEKTLYTGAYHDLINKFIKEHGIKKTFDSKKITFRGNELTADQAMGLYISTKVQANYDAINEDGAGFYDTKNKNYVELAKKGEAEALKTEINNVLPTEYKQLADFLLDTINGSVKKEYINWYENKFGKYQRRNEIGEIKENSYWILARQYQKLTNLSKAVSNPNAIFSHAIRRTNGGNNAVLITGALSSFDSYIDKLGREIYIKPAYEDALSVLNTKGADKKSVMDLLSERVDYGKDAKYIEDTLAEILGANQKQNNLLDKMVAAFSVAKLSLNIGSMMKQFASIYTSNLPFSKSAKALLARAFGKDEFKSEYKTLVNEIGGLKYREANKGVLMANADSVGQITEKIARVGMYGISKVDMFTIGTGVYSLMVIGQDQFGYKVGTQQNTDFVKEHWAEFELSQIGNSALSRNYISSADSLTRYLFGFLQGANRAALGSQIHKYGLWNRNKNVNVKELQSQLKSAKERLEKATREYQVNDESESVRKEYIEASAEVLDLENRIKDYRSYEIAGGKNIPVNMAAGIVAQGVLIALVNALMKRIKGKKDWDEFNVQEEALNLALAIGVDWVPLVNFAANIVQGYDVDVPAVNLFNQFGDIFSSAKGGNWTTTLRQIALLVGDMTGIPFQTIYQYIYGAIKTFDPAIAYEMNSVLYGSSVQSATKTLQSYADRGNTNKTTSMVGLIMEKYKTGSSTDAVNRELANLYISGYNALPKTAMTQYTDSDGNTVKLTSEQITQFQEIYSQSTKDVSDLIKLTDYKNLTDAEKAKAIKKIYDAYYEGAKAVVSGANTSNKLARIVALSGGKANIGKYAFALQKIAEITETTKKTRKELVIQYINRLKGYSKADKVMLMYLAGYSVTGSSQSILIRQFMSYGLTRKEALALI